MPKHKTKKSVARRFKVTKNGKVLHRSSFSRHLRATKSGAQKNRYKKMKSIEGAMARKIKIILGK